jgi:hypothetical protein
VPALEEALGARVDRGFPDSALSRSEGDGDVPEETERVYRELCSLAGVEPAAIEERSHVGS